MQRGHISGERYCGNYATRKVHDLTNEQQACNINEFVAAGEDIPFLSLEIAARAGYSYCEHCIAVI